MFKQFRIQIDGDPIFIAAWKNFIDPISSNKLTYGAVNNILINYNAYLTENDDHSHEIFRYPVLTFRDCEGYTEFMLKWS